MVSIFNWASVLPKQQFSAMALSSRLAGRSSSLLRQVTTAASSPAKRTLTTRTTRCLYAKNEVFLSKGTRYARLFSSTCIRRDQTQTAPNAKAYLESGVIKGAKNPVDVKKVLVIGSGGLSIGQAGEFDYSGWSSSPLAAHESCSRSGKLSSSSIQRDNC